ncbi:MAG: beta-ketoacyl synthase N-terminal-like domain-containing protein [Candidatus Brocadiia bacterium]
MNDRQNKTESIYITGLGCVSALGVGIEAIAEPFWSSDNLLEDKESARNKGLPQCCVPEFDVSDFIPTKRPYLDPNSRFALVAGGMALHASGPGEEIINPARSGVATGTVLGNINSQEKFQYGIMEKGVRLASPMLFPHCYPNTSNSLLSIEFGLRGYNQNICGNRVSGAKAVQLGAQAIHSGHADLMLVGGSDALSETVLNAWEQGDNNRTIPPGEGAAFLVLENEFSLERRSSSPACRLASILSCGTGVLPEESGIDVERKITRTVKDTIEQALEQASLWEGDLGAVFTTLSLDEDRVVSRALSDALASSSQVPKFPPSRRIGDTLAAAFGMGSILAALIVNEEKLPSPPQLEDVQNGVELWVEEMPSGMLGKAVAVVDCSEHNVVVAILSAS